MHLDRPAADRLNRALVKLLFSILILLAVSWSARDVWPDAKMLADTLPPTRVVTSSPSLISPKPPPEVKSPEDPKPSTMANPTKVPHAAALAFVVWYMLAPPTAPGGRLDNRAPLSKWKVIKVYDTEARCRARAADRLEDALT